jgi:hypothetical protein
VKQILRKNGKTYKTSKISSILKLRKNRDEKTEAQKTSYKKWLASKKLQDKMEYKRNTALAKREVIRRHRASWDKFVTNVEHKT